jgi:hypothetical protein
MASAAAGSARFGCELKGQSGRDSLAFDLDKRSIFLTNVGAPVAVAGTCVLHRHLVRAIFYYETVAASVFVSQLDEFPAAANANLPIDRSIAVLDGPLALGQPT